MNQSSLWLPPGDLNRLPRRVPYAQEIPEPVDPPDHLDVAVEQFGEAGRPGEHGAPPADELAGHVKRVFERFPQVVSRCANRSRIASILCLKAGARSGESRTRVTREGSAVSSLSSLSASTTPSSTTQAPRAASASSKRAYCASNRHLRSGGREVSCPADGRPLLGFSGSRVGGLPG